MSLQMLRKSAIISSNRESGLTIEYWFATFSPENANFVRETQYRPIVHTRFVGAFRLARFSGIGVPPAKLGGVRSFFDFF